jgi:predicted component of type VI protein secretion system
MPYLAIHVEGKPPARRALDGGKALILGRSLESDLWIEDSRLSRQHCRFEQTPSGEWAVADLASKNGTYVSGERISYHRLRDGEEVLLGRARVVFHSGAMPQARPQEPTTSRTAGDTAVAPAMSPDDTLVDSRAGMPSPQPRHVARDDDPGAAHRPLPFRRERPQPMPDDAPKRGWLRALFRRRR